MSLEIVIAELENAGFISDGATAEERVRVPTSRSPVFGRSGGERRTFGGRQRWVLPGTNVCCTIGARTVFVYRKQANGVAPVGTFDTKGIDGVKLRAALTPPPATSGGSNV